MSTLRGALFLALATTVGTARAEWLPVSSTRSGAMTVYADPSSIIKRGHLAKMKTLLDFKTVQNGDSDSAFLSSRDRSEFDCRQKRRRTIFFANHTENMGGGSVNFSSSTATPWEPVAPRSVSEAIWKLACGSQ